MKYLPFHTTKYDLFNHSLTNTLKVPRWLIFALYIVITILTLYIAWSHISSNQMKDHFTNDNDNGPITSGELYPIWYDTIFRNKEFYDLDLQMISPYIESYTKHSLDIALEIGCGSGIWIEWLHAKHPTLPIVALEKDPTFASYCKKKFSHMQIMEGTARQRNHFSRESFRFIFCLRDTLYHQTKAERQRMWENMYMWLQPGGFIFLHTFQRNKLVPGPQNYSQCHRGKKDELICYTYFDSFIHMASFLPVSTDIENDAYRYKERIQVIEKQTHTGKEKMKMEVDMEHTLYFPTREELEEEWKSNGFTLVEEISYAKHWIPDITLCVLYKPKIN
jgi:SAM-dependent methyltransferase